MNRIVDWLIEEKDFLSGVVFGMILGFEISAMAMILLD